MLNHDLSVFEFNPGLEVLNLANNGFNFSLIPLRKLINLRMLGISDNNFTGLEYLHEDIELHCEINSDIDYGDGIYQELMNLK
jgi:hypothetical protein